MKEENSGEERMENEDILGACEAQVFEVECSQCSCRVCGLL
jgi:hypothetical protein